MSWSRRSLLCALPALAACGFTPVYGPGGAAEGLSGQIAIDPPRDEEGYLFVRHMEERLGRAGAAAPYRLSADISVNEERLGTDLGGNTTRIRLVGQARYRLIERATDTVLTTGDLQTFTAYSAPIFDAARVTIAGNPVTVRAARRDAIERLMVSLGDQIVSELLATAPAWRQ